MRQAEPRLEKVKSVQEIKEKIGSSKVVIFTNYQGLKVSEITLLRNDLRKNTAEYQVVKNTLLERALGADSYAGLKESIKGPIAVIFGFADEVLPAKIVFDFAKKYEKPEIVGGIFDHRITSAAELKIISSLPSRDELLAKVVGGINAPLAGLHGALLGILGKLVFALEAIKKLKEEVKSSV